MFAREQRRVVAAVVDPAVCDQRDCGFEDRQPPVERLLRRLLRIASFRSPRLQPLEVLARVAPAAAARDRLRPYPAAAHVGIERRAVDAEEPCGLLGVEPRVVPGFHIDRCINIDGQPHQQYFVGREPAIRSRNKRRARGCHRGRRPNSLWRTRLLWIVATLIAALAQTARNAMQSSLTAVLGTVGAAQVRFLYGLPFALLFLALAAALTDARVPPPTIAFIGYTGAGALAQIVGTVLLLAAMHAGSFSVATAFTKTEPVQVAIFAFAVLGERLTPLAIGAIVIATAGVVLAAWRGSGRSGA